MRLTTFLCLGVLAQWLWAGVTASFLLRCLFVAEDGTPLTNVPAQADLIPAPPAQGGQSGTRGVTDSQGQLLVLLPNQRPWWVIAGVAGAAFFLDIRNPSPQPMVVKCWLGSKPSLLCRVDGDATKVALFLRLSPSPWWVRLPPFKDGELLLFNLPPGDHQLVLTPTQVLTYWSEALSLQPPVTVTIREGQITHITFRVPPLGTIEGRILDPSNHPIPNATVILSQKGFGQMSALSDANGQFRLDGVPEGAYQLLVTAADYEAVERPVVVKADAPLNLTVTLKPLQLGIVKGRVLGSDRQVVKDGRIFVERILSPSVRQPVGIWFWDADGRFEGKVPSGVYLLTAQAGGKRVSKQVRVEANRETDAGEWVLPQPAFVEGIVKSRIPLANTRVRAMVLRESDDPLQPQWGSIVAESPVASDGRFKLEVPSEPLAIVLFPFGSGKPLLQRIHPKPGQRVLIRFELPETGAIEGQVVRTDTGQPVAQALVYLLDETGMTVGQTMTNRLGMYRFEPLLPGRYSVRCQAQGLAMGFRHNVRVSEGSRVPVDFVLTVGGTIVGWVKTKREQPRMYVLVDADTNLMALVGLDGRFQIDHIAPGRHIVMLFRLGEQIATKEVFVKSGEAVEVEFELPQ